MIVIGSKSYLSLIVSGILALISIGVAVAGFIIDGKTMIIFGIILGIIYIITFGLYLFDRNDKVIKYDEGLIINGRKYKYKELRYAEMYPLYIGTKVLARDRIRVHTNTGFIIIKHLGEAEFVKDAINNCISNHKENKSSES